MQFLSTLALSALAATMVAAVKPNANEPGAKVDSKFVTTLSTKNYEEFLKKNKFALVEYYAPCTVLLGLCTDIIRVRSLQAFGSRVCQGCWRVG